MSPKVLGWATAAWVMSTDAMRIPSFVRELLIAIDEWSQLAGSSFIQAGVASRAGLISGIERHESLYYLCDGFGGGSHSHNHNILHGHSRARQRAAAAGL
jgi:hypothetical protein